MKTQRILISVFVPAILLLAAAVGLTYAQGPEPPSHHASQESLGTAFTYQGQLRLNGEPVNEECEMVFRLYDHATTGSQVGTPITETVAISDGLFTQSLDFGSGAFVGDARWLSIQVQCQGDLGFTDLGRQALTATPYALHALSVPWSGLTGVPAGFADEVDNNTTYTPGTGLVLTGTVFSADTTFLQRRVGSACAVDSAIRVVYADGTVLCQSVAGGTGDITAVYGGDGLTGGATSGPVTLTVAFSGTGSAATVSRADHDHGGVYSPVGHNHDARYYTESELQTGGSATVHWNNLSNVPTGLDDGDNDTTYSPGAGLVLTGTVFGADTTFLQRRVDSSCGAGSSIRVINANGTVVCEADDDTDTTYSAGTGMDLIGTAFSVEPGYRLPQGCGIGEIAEWNGSAWACEVDEDSGGDITGVHAGDGLAGGGASGEVTLTVAYGGSGGDYGSATTAARSDHAHDGLYYRENELNTSGGGGQVHWDNLLDVPMGLGDGDDDTLGGMSCGSNEIAKWSGSAWVCSADEGAVGDFWSLNGNAGTVPNTHFVGTTDWVSLTMIVNGTPALRLHPTGGSPNVVGGDGANHTYAGVTGAAIGGGGSGVDPNRAADTHGTVGGGAANLAGSDDDNPNNASWATVGGGLHNTAGAEGATVSGGIFNQAAGPFSAVSGGDGNVAAANNTAIGGGLGNEAHGPISTIAGGQSNFIESVGAAIGGGDQITVTGDYATVGGGQHNLINSTSGTIGGGFHNTVIDLAGVVGGGAYNTASNWYATVSGGYSNTASGSEATIGGGWGNTASNWHTTVGGGLNNNASGDKSTIGGGHDNTTDGFLATVGGGYSNAASGNDSTIGGGWSNAVSGWRATIAGGSNITVTGDYAVAGGGRDNLVTGTYATVAGGWNNTALYDFAAIGGGTDNTANDIYTTVSGGSHNTASDNYATIGGGFNHTASGYASAIGGGYWSSAIGDYSTVGGGWMHNASGSLATVAGGESNTASGSDATVSGGGYNTASGDHATIGGGEYINVTGQAATVAGGTYITVTGNYASAGGGRNNVITGTYDTVGGGWYNTARGWYATIGGGCQNTVSGTATTVAGGILNTASDRRATVGGGESNEASGWYATIPGGFQNATKGWYSFAAGYRARALDFGSFVWSDPSSLTPYSSTASYQFRARASGGVYFHSNSGATTGVYLAPGSSSWASTSDRALKENFVPVDAVEVLEQVASLPVESWNLRSQDPSIRHIGPVAQDFYAAFGFGEDNLHINMQDANGVALAAIQGLHQQNLELQEQVNDLEERLEALEAGSAASPAHSSFLPWWGALLAGVGLAWVFKKEHIMALVRGEGR